MKALKFILLIVLVLVVGVAGLNTAQQRGWLDNTPLASAHLPELPLALNKLKIGSAASSSPDSAAPDSLSSQLTTLSERSSNVAGHVQKVLGTTIEVDTQPEPIHERAFEYGRYLYCQQVIKEYEQSQSLAPSPQPE